MRHSNPSTRRRRTRPRLTAAAVRRGCPPGAATLLLAVIAVLAIGCRSRDDKATEGSANSGRVPGAAVVGTVFDVPTVNELIDPGSGLSGAVIDLLFASLVTDQPDLAGGPGEFVPDLAASWSYSEDRTAITFELREAQWSDGTPISAQDVLFTWQAQTSPEVGWPFADIKSNIKDVEVLAPASVRFHLHRQAAHSDLALINDGVILPSHAWGALPFSEWRTGGAWFEEHLVTSGPMTMQARRAGETIELKRNPSYWNNDSTTLERAVFRIVPDRAALVEQLLSGSVDVMRHPPTSDLERLEQSPEVDLLTYPNRNFDFVMWNVKRPPFTSGRLRLAMQLAVDREAMVETLIAGRGQVASSPFVTWAWPKAPVPPRVFDPDAAEMLLERGGWQDNGDGPRTKGGEPLRFELLTIAGNSRRARAAQMLQAQLAEVGVEVVIDSVDVSRFTQKTTSHDFDAALFGLSMDTSFDLSYSFHSDAIDGGLNYGGYASEDLDRLIERVNAAPDLATLEPDLQAIRKHFRDRQPLLFLYEADGVVAARRNVHNVQPSALGEFVNLPQWRVTD